MAKYYTGGRGRGVLGALEKGLIRRPGQTNPDNFQEARETERETATAKENDDTTPLTKRLLVAHNYTANPDSPGGFNELTVKKGQLLVFISEHPSNEHWWQAKNEDGEIGYVPSSYVIIKEDQVLPWLEQNVLIAREQERKDRLQRQLQQKDLNEGVGFGPPPKPAEKPYVYVSAYNRTPSAQSDTSAANRYYCDVCKRTFNGPKPYKAHMVSKAHREELQIREEFGS